MKNRSIAQTLQRLQEKKACLSLSISSLQAEVEKEESEAWKLQALRDELADAFLAAEAAAEAVKKEGRK